MPGVVAKAGALYEGRMQRVHYRRTLRVLPTALLFHRRRGKNIAIRKYIMFTLRRSKRKSQRGIVGGH